MSSTDESFEDGKRPPRIADGFDGENVNRENPVEASVRKNPARCPSGADGAVPLAGEA